MAKGYDNIIYNQNLVLHLPFIGGDDEVIDHSKRRNNLTIVNTPTRDQLANGFPIMDFISADSDYLTRPNASSADLKFSTEFTLSFFLYWTQTVGANIHSIIGLTDGGVDGWKVYLRDDGDKRIWVGMSDGGMRYSNSGVIELATWYHVGIIFNNGDLNFYINNVNSNNTISTYAAIDPEGTRNFVIGRNDPLGAEYADIKLASMKAYNADIGRDKLRQDFESKRKLVGIA